MKILVWANYFRANLLYLSYDFVECKQVTGLFYPPTELITFHHSYKIMCLKVETELSIFVCSLTDIPILQDSTSRPCFTPFYS